jgi:signal transduction histidine kinase
MKEDAMEASAGQSHAAIGTMFLDVGPRPRDEPRPALPILGGLRVLMVEDSPPDVELTEHTLRDAGLDFRCAAVSRRDMFEMELARQPPDVILADYSVPGFDGRQALQIAKERVPNTPFIFVSGVLGEEVAIELLKQGATDYVLKTHLARLGPAVHRALREARERRERQSAEDKLRSSHEQLRALTNHLHSVREEERTRIARQVHDELGQALTGLKLDLSWLNSKLRGARGLQRKIKAMSAHIDDTINTVRRIATDLRPGVLDSLGLVAAIEWQAGDFQQRTGIACAVSIDVTETMLDPDFTTVCFRIFQETLTNIIRHAKATQVEVRLAHAEGFLVLTVRDNGRGISERDINDRSIGLIGMKERAAQVRGEVFFFGLPTHGTTVTLRVPLPAGSTMTSTHGHRPDRGEPGL